LTAVDSSRAARRARRLRLAGGRPCARALRRRNGHGAKRSRANPSAANGRPHDVAGDEPAEELLRCATCGRRRPLDEFGRDASRSNGHRSRCRSCRREREYRPRARRAREKASPAARDSERDDERPRPAGRAAENGRAASTVPDAGERTPTVDEWLLEAGLAERNGRGLVATALGVELGGYLDDYLGSLAR
jgi:hypothetical protein